MEDIYELALTYRNAIEDAKNNDEFIADNSFYKFPRGCCGDTSDLLGQYLVEHNFEVFYVCGTYRPDSYENIQSHGWLVTKENIIIDITGDQFSNQADFLNHEIAVYVGKADKFYRLFKEIQRDTKPYQGIESLGSGCQPRLLSLHEKILKYIK